MGDRRVALITGARRGIGRATALALAEAGFDTAINDIARDGDGEATVAALTERGARVKFITADIGDIDSHDAMLDEVYGTFGRLDCLVNNAGVQLANRVDLLETEVSEFDRMIRVNLRG
ncbi:MAG: SDR family NAD(P)-dependent oxidoreductase, partial [Dongiales bacterium]